MPMRCPKRHREKRRITTFRPGGRALFPGAGTDPAATVELAAGRATRPEPAELEPVFAGPDVQHHDPGRHGRERTRRLGKHVRFISFGGIRCSSGTRCAERHNIRPSPDVGAWGGAVGRPDGPPVVLRAVRRTAARARGGVCAPLRPGETPAPRRVRRARRRDRRTARIRAPAPRATRRGRRVRTAARRRARCNGPSSRRRRRRTARAR